MGNLIQIPEVSEGAVKYGNTGFTVEQVVVIEGYIRQRNMSSAETGRKFDATSDYEFKSNMY